MRIISGKFKGKKLFSPNNNLIRPTSDRAKEMIFNTLNSYFLNKNINFENLIVLDCFCGSGAIGLEFLSRGSKEVIFVDNSLESINLTKKNFSSLNSSQSVTFLNIDYKEIRLSKSKINFFYLDPPYKKINIKDILFSFSITKILEKNVLGIIELPIDYESDNLEGYEVWLKKKISRSLFYFIKKIN